MTTDTPITPRQIRQARDRRVSIALAIVIGVIMGVGGFLWMRHDDKAVAPALVTIPPTAKDTSSKVATLTPHKALYRVELSGTRSGTQIIDIQGQMFFKMHQGCDGYITDHRFVLTYHYADSDPMRITSDFSTVENFAGTEFSFTSRRRRDGELYQEIKGQGTLPPDGPGQVTYEEPDTRDYVLPNGTLFPSAHTKSLLQAAAKGPKFMAQTIFDGSDEDGPVDMTAILGPSRPLAKTKWPAAVDPSLLVGPLHPIQMAFFPRARAQETSDYDIEMDLLSNGVITGMSIDYHDFSVKQTLLALEPLPPEECK